MINAQKLRELIAGANAATEAHGETDWYAPPGTIYIDPNGIGKADFEFIAFLSPERATALLDHIDAQTAEIAAMTQHANFLNADIARLRSRIAELREALNCTWMALEGYLPDHRNDVTDRAVAMARAALSGESNE